ncbi:protein translocase subunit SecF [Tissierella sp. P1]|jgi:preprotein translocase subunit SecF|uniref:protein translocase subunit SecF n=1 Tax=unclassified Tissierella TaxID=2638726 RepID=UPI001911DB84|nr:protein translocase subunit SecF [Tissierella sp. P1]MDU5081177.1 protein translocase subunit SecF [Bacillota bacterium]
MNIIKNRKIFAICSIAIIIAGILMFFIKGLNYGIDFTGGTLIQINAGKFIPVDEVREITDEYDKNVSILHGGTEKDELIIKSTLDLSNDVITDIINKFIEKYDINKNNFQSEKFGPFMGAEIKNKALLSTLIATVLMLGYITWRFEFNFGVAAIVALAHDILIMLAVYSILRIPVNSSFIAAILTILGYSINDTIVIFDRIRENTKLYPRESVENIINNSIKQSLKRTIYTTLTTLMAVTVLYILGVEDVKVLTLPLIIGMIAGVYSSLFIAAPLWYELKNRKIKAAK